MTTKRSPFKINPIIISVLFMFLGESEYFMIFLWSFDDNFVGRPYPNLEVQV